MRVFFPLIALYGLMLWGLASAVTHRAIPWQDPQITKIGARLVLYPVVLMTVALIGFAGFARLIDHGNPNTVFVLPLGAALFALALLKLALVMINDVRRAQSTPNKETDLED